LIVIDFIDMEENKNNRAVEKRLKECLKVDRARVQHGRISQFGLMEISRQRRRQGVLQATSDPCPACNGTGRRRSIPSAALQLIRAIEARAAIGALKGISVKAPTDVALYILNNKREALIEIERVAGFAVSIHSSEDMLPGDFQLDAERDPNAKPKKRSTPRSLMKPTPASTRDEDDEDAEEIDDTVDAGDEAEDDAAEPRAEKPEGTEGGNGGRKRRRRRRGGKGREARDTGLEVVDADAPVAAEASPMSDDEGDDEDEDGDEGSVAPRADGEEGPRKRRRRGRRGGRRRRRSGEVRPEGSEIAAIADGGAYLDGLSASAEAMLSDEDVVGDGEFSAAEAPAEAGLITGEEPDAEEAPARKPRPPRRSRAKAAPVEAEAESLAAEAEVTPVEPAPVVEASAPEPEPVRAAAETPAPAPAPEPTPAPAPAPQPEGPRKTGWWNRGKK